MGDYIEMGTYKKVTDWSAEATPIKWRCVAFEKIAGYDEAGNPIMDPTDTVTEPTAGYLPLMLADTYVCIKEFDVSGEDDSGSHGWSPHRKTNPALAGGSNYWGDSTLRC